MLRCPLCPRQTCFDRGGIAERVLGSLVNWEFVAENLDGKGVAGPTRTRLARHSLPALPNADTSK